MKKYGIWGMFCAFLLALSLVSTVRAATPVLSMSPLTSDADIVNTNADYLYAINFVNTNSYTVNDIPFTSVSGHSGSGKTAAQAFTFRSLNTGGNSTNASATSSASGLPESIKNLFTGFVSNGNNSIDGAARLMLTGLEEGKTYTLSILSSAWANETGNLRTSTFYFDADADGLFDAFRPYNSVSTTYGQAINQSQPLTDSWAALGNGTLSGQTSPYAVNYQFTAGSDTLSAYIQGATFNNSWHLYSFALYENTDIAPVAVPGLSIKNNSFEADTFVAAADTGNHGYTNVNNNGLLSGWTVTTPNRVGLAPLWSSFALDPDSSKPVRSGSLCTDFLNGDDKSVVDGEQVVFVQRGTDGTYGAISQEVSGFTAGEYYILTYSARRRSGYDIPAMTVTTGDQTLVQLVNPTSFFDADGEVIQYSRVFKATGDTQTIGFEGGRINATWSGTTNDTTALLDNVQVELKKLYFTKVFGDNFSVVNNSNTVRNFTDPSNDAANRFSGVLGGDIGYNEKGGAGIATNGADNLQQVGHASARGYINGFNNDALMLATRQSGGQPYAGVTLDHNFIDEFDASEGAMYRLEFSVAPLYAYGVTDGAVLNPQGTIDSWAGVIFGSSADPANVNNSDGIGILFRQNGGIQIFDKTNTVYSADPGTLDTSDGWFDVAIEYWVSDFDGSSVGVDLYVDDVLIHSFGTLTGIDENYISFMSYMSSSVSPSDNFHYTYFDDIAVYSTAYGLPETAVPEPGTWLMLILGLAGLAFRRFRR